MFKKVIYTALFLAIFVSGYNAYQYYSYINERTAEADQHGIASTYEIKQHLDSIIRNTSNWTNNIAKEILIREFTKEELEQFILDKTSNLSIGLGLTVAFEPYAFNKEIEFYAPYYDLKQQSLIDIGNLYDYTEKGLSHTIWYTNPMSSDKGVWCEPYFAKGANRFVVDYGVPLVKGGKYIGVVSFTFSLENFAKYVNGLTTGYGFVASRDLDLILHPRTDYMLRPELVAKAVEGVPEFGRLRKEDQGHFRYFSTYSYQESELYFNKLANDWVLCVVFSTKDLLGKAVKLDNKIIDFFLSISLVIFIVSVILLNVQQGRTRHLWYLSIVMTGLLVFNIVLIWVLNINMNFGKESAYVPITNQTELNQILDKRNQELNKIGYPKSHEIRTGIFIGDVDFKDAYSVAISGKIWQKFPDTVEITHDLNWVFPQKAPASRVSTEVVTKTHVDDYWLYRYNFTATLEFDFDYRKFPMDYRLLNIKMMYPDIHENRILVPDFSGYDIMDPGTAPGVSDDIYLPNSEILSSVFSISSTEFKSNLGNEQYNGPTKAPVLEFNVVVKRNIINALIINVLPIVVIAVLVFLLYFTIHKVNGELIEGSALTVIQATGGFIFVLLLGHIQLRRTLETPDLSYIETFYIVMYVVIATMATGILLYVKTDRFAILEYKNNIFVKLTYWPFLLTLIYVISLFTFY